MKEIKHNKVILILGILIIVAIPVTLLINNMSGGLISACRYSQSALTDSINVKKAYIRFNGHGVNTELNIEQDSGDPYIVDIYPGNSENLAHKFIDTIDRNESLKNNVQVNYVVNTFLGRPKNVISLVISDKERFDFCK